MIAIARYLRDLCTNDTYGARLREDLAGRLMTWVIVVPFCVLAAAVLWLSIVGFGYFLCLLLAGRVVIQ